MMSLVSILSKRNTFFVGLEPLIVRIFDEEKRHLMIKFFRKHDIELEHSFDLFRIDIEWQIKEYFQGVNLRFVQKFRILKARSGIRVLFDKMGIVEANLLSVQLFVIRLLQ